MLAKKEKEENKRNEKSFCFLNEGGGDRCFWRLFDASAQELMDSLMYVHIHMYKFIRCLTVTVRVVPSQISNLERKRSQYQDYGFVPSEIQSNAAAKRGHLRNVSKELCKRLWVCDICDISMFL